MLLKSNLPEITSTQLPWKYKIGKETILVISQVISSYALMESNSFVTVSVQFDKKNKNKNPTMYIIMIFDSYLKEMQLNF